MNNNLNKSGAEKEGRNNVTNITDIVIWSLWLVMMWGFLIILMVVDSPTNSPGIHELIITAYFFGFSIVFAVVYLLILKRG
ncbi:MAG TPA: hypothetical protein VK135_02615 [Candidatus Dormibacteraeota bacterium]|nr:hypothetical protein [Candidatus Dormibacteraeota bacterium]